MRDHASWSISLGRWGDAHVRLHMLFLLFALCTLYLSWLAGEPAGEPALLWSGVLSIALLTLAVVVHIAGHIYAASQLDLEFDPIVVGPLGELGTHEEAINPRAELLTALAGPAMNLLVVLLCLPPLLMAQNQDGSVNVLGLLHPLAPADLTSGPTWLAALKLSLWINWMLALVNLVPAGPFDGGRIVRAAVRLIWPGISERRALRIGARTAKVAALLLILVAWFMSSSTTTQLVPPWFVLTLLAILLFFSAQQDEARRETPGMERDEHPFGYDFSQGYTSLERSEQEFHDAEEVPGSPLDRWLGGRREARRRRQEEIEAEEDALVDEILARLHSNGMHSLSPEERSLLERASQRYRSRPQP